MRKTFSQVVCDTCGTEVELMGSWQYADAVASGREPSRLRGWWHLEQLGQPAAALLSSPPRDTTERRDFCSWRCLADFVAKRA